MSETTVIAPVVKVIEVRCSTEDAFRVFTRELARWWPTEDFSISGDVLEVVWEEHEGGGVYEVSADGARAHWATVLAWEPPRRLVVSWHVNPERPATEVEVCFEPTADGTRVELVHRGWEALGGEASDSRGSYDTGWDHVLGRFLAAITP